MSSNLKPLLTAILLILVGGCTRGPSYPENSLQYPININLKSLDPAQSSDDATNEVIPNLYEGLLQYNYLKRPLTVEPLLADGMPIVSKDRLTYTFKIKPGIRFQNSEVFSDGRGREVTAQDFIYSWKRIADPKTMSAGFWIFDGKIKGLNEWRENLAKGAANFDAKIEGLSAPDSHTLVIQLIRPYYQLPYVLTMDYASVVAQEAVSKYGAEFLSHPVGTGPFLLESWVRGGRVVLSKNPNWHGGTYPTEGSSEDQEKGLLTDSGKALPFIEKLIFLEMPEDQPRWFHFIRGQVDFEIIPKDNYDAAVEKNSIRPDLGEKGIHLLNYPYPDINYIAFNMQDPLLGKNVYLRKALALAYDTRLPLEKFYNNRGVIAQSPIAVDMDGYDPAFQNPWKVYDLEKAKQFMKKAGFPDGRGLPTFEYSITSSATARQIAELISMQWQKIGVKLNIVATSWPQFQERVQAKKAQLFHMSWFADYPDSENMLQLLYGPNISPGPNAANYRNSKFDALFEKARLLAPGPERTALYRKMRDVFVEDMPWIPTVHRTGALVEHGWLRNLKPHKTIHGFYKYLRIDVAKKRELKRNL